MQSAEALKYLLGIQDPWEIHEVEAAADNGRMDIHVRLGDGGGDAQCPQCGMPLGTDMTAETKIWRHMNLGAMQTYLHLPVPPCAQYGCTVMESWGDSEAPFTKGMQHQFINALRFCASVPSAADLLAIPWEDVQQDKELIVAKATGRRTPRTAPMPAESFEAQRSPAAESANGIPAASHPNWQRLLDEQLPITVKTLGLQMLLMRIRSSMDQEITSEQRLARIGEVRDYCVKYQRFVQNELDQLFGH